MLNLHCNNNDKKQKNIKKNYAVTEIRTHYAMEAHEIND